MEEQKYKVRQFGLTVGALNNRSTVYLATFLLALIGFMSYMQMPKESFPEVNFPYVAVTTIYPGNAPEDVENLITRQLEKEIYTIKGIKTMSSSSIQGTSQVMVEFNPGVDIDDALQDVKDAVDKAKSDLPTDLDQDPIITEIDVSEFPIMNLNMSGPYSVTQLRDIAEVLEEEIEAVSEISKVELKGVDEREIRIDVDANKMESMQISLGDIEGALANENISVAGGEVNVARTRRTIRTIGQFEDVNEMPNIVVKAEKGNTVYLRDIATVTDGWEETKSYARLDRQSVVSLQVVKKGGENLLNASDKIFALIEKERKSGVIPEDLRITVTNDQSEEIRDQISNLWNNIIMGFIFVASVLFFFLGWRNALIVGLAIPMSMFISFVVLSAMGITINMMVLFALVLALGMLVDNGIVAVENIHRFLSQGESLIDACRNAVSEIAWPIISSTATTVAAFVPLAFWPGMIGEFMKYLPITLIIVLSSSLFVALVIIPVIAVAFIKPGHDETPQTKPTFITLGVLVGLALVMYLAKNIALANFILVVATVIFLNWAVFYRVAVWFQDVALSKLEAFYELVITYTLKGARPTVVILSTFGLLILTLVLLAVRQPRVELFPNNAPVYINIQSILPVGSDINATDSIVRLIEGEVYQYLDSTNYKKVVESVMSTVGKGAVGEGERVIGDSPNRGITTLTFIDYEERDGIDTRDISRDLSHRLSNKYPGVSVTVAKNHNGPPTGKPINIELSGDDFETLLTLADSVQNFIGKSYITGMEGLRLDIDLGKPELLINIDRAKARQFGLSTMQIAGTIRNALYGKEVTKFKDGDDDIPVYVRLGEEFRNSVPALLSQKITFRNNQGTIMQIPISSVVNINYSSTFEAIKRINKERVITLYSDLVEGANAAEINKDIRRLLKSYPMPEGYKWKLTGEQEEQEKSMAFLGRAMLLAVGAILLILVTQFNSVPKPTLIGISILFSTIGVFGGFATFKMDLVIIMTGIGIISLAGVVVNNAIVLIDYIDYLKSQARVERGLQPTDNLPMSVVDQIIEQAGKTRLRPVLLTAITTVLGLVPMAIGLNIDILSALSDFNPNIYFGGENADFWAPMAWTVIFGLTFSTILTLVVVPAMYREANRFKIWVAKLRS